MVILICMLLLSICGISVVLGLYSLQGGAQRTLNRLFLEICITLVIWAFGLAVAMGAQKGSASTFGIRLAVVGWSLSNCAILSFLAELTGSRSILKKWWGILIFYLPPALDLISYFLLTAAGHSPDMMVHTPLGWIAFISSRNLWFRFHLAQVLLFTILSLSLLVQWSLRTRSSSVRRQALLLILSFSLSALLGFVSDIFPVYLGIRIPRLSAIFVFFPLMAIAYLIRCHHFLQPEENDPDSVILAGATRTHIYFIFCLATAAFSILNLFLSPSASPLPISFFLLAVTLYLLIVYLVPTGGAFKEMWLAICISFVIPVISLWSSQIGNSTIWVFVFAIMLGSLLSNRLTFLGTSVVSSLLTQVFIWFHQSVAFADISPFTYIARLLLLTWFAALSSYVHSIYVRRLRENVALTARQSLISEISLSFISANTDTLDEKLSSTLERCGRLIRCERAHLIFLEEDGKAIRYSKEWLTEGASSGLEALKKNLREPDPVLRHCIASGQAIVIQDVKLMPASDEIKEQLLGMKIRALTLIPLKRGDQLLGFFGFNADFPMRKWNLEDSTFLHAVAGILTDAVLKVDAEQKINFIAYHDQLTGLPNRLLFNDRLRQAIAAGTDTPLAVVFIDLDSFKFINDTMGHSTGDLLLTAVAQSLTCAAGKGSVVSRFGGDEFIILLREFSGRTGLLRILGRLTDALNKAFILNGQKAFVTASMGIALYPQDGSDVETLIKNADASMYHAKSMGKNQYALCSPEMKEAISDQTKLSNLLYRAIEKEQLVLYYQPRVDTESQRIVGCEALIRWNLPGHGMMMPADFIPLAEQTGLIHSIGEWVLETACRQNRVWHEKGFDNLRMAANLSAQQLNNPKFVNQVADILSRTGLPARSLELEITENVANRSILNIAGVLKRLKKLGISISIDDFGTEYSSLARLKQLPIDRIKMDMQFVQGIDLSEKDQAISKVIISLAKSLDLKVTAEGVETGSQKDFLTQKRCDEAQGFYFFHPMPADQVERILRKNLLP